MDPRASSDTVAMAGVESDGRARLFQLLGNAEFFLWFCLPFVKAHAAPDTAEEILLLLTGIHNELASDD